MFTKTVQNILSRAMNEPEFADRLFANPKQVLAGYFLAPSEIRIFEEMSQAEFKVMVAEERTSFGLNNHNESALKVRKGVKVNHNESALKVRRGVRVNHNESALKVRKGVKYNHNESMMRLK